MTATTAVRNGIGQVLGAKRLWLTYYAATLCFGFAAALPLALLAAGNLSSSTWPARMQQQFDLGWLIEFMHKSGGAVSGTYGPVVLGLGAGYLLLGTFLSGGAIAYFAGGTAYESGAFWGACGRNFARLFRLLVYSGALYAAVLVINSLLETLGGRMFAESMEERPVAIFAWIRAGFTLLLLLYVNMVMDYARVRLVVDDSRKSLRAAFGAFRFVWTNFGPASGAFALVFVILAVLAAVGHVANRVLPWVLVIVAQQLFVFARLLTKLLFYASETQVYTALRPVPVVLPSEPEIATEPATDFAPATDAETEVAVERAEEAERTPAQPANGDALASIARTPEDTADRAGE